MFKLFALFLLSFLLVPACQNNPHTEEAGEKMEEAADEMGKALEMEQQQLKADLEEAQTDLQSRIDQLKADMENASADAKADMQEELNRLEALQTKVSQNLSEFGEKAGSEWEQFKANVKTTIQEIGEDKKEQ